LDSWIISSLSYCFFDVYLLGPGFLLNSGSRVFQRYPLIRSVDYFMWTLRFWVLKCVRLRVGGSFLFLCMTPRMLPWHHEWNRWLCGKLRYYVITATRHNIHVPIHLYAASPLRPKRHNKYRWSWFWWWWCTRQLVYYLFKIDEK